MTVAATASFLLLSGCAWRRIATSAAPDGKAKVEVSELPALADARLKVEFVAEGHRVPLYDRRTDWVLGLSKIEWFGPNRVGVYLCNHIGEPLLVGYDLQTSSFMQPNAVREALRRSIQADYALDIARSAEKGDPLDWACSDEGTAAFQARKGKASRK